MIQVYDDKYINSLIEEISKLLKEERLKKGYTLNQMAQMANINPSQLSKIENCDSKMGITSLVKIMLALDMPVICFKDDYRKNKYYHRFDKAIQGLKPETIESILTLLESLNG